MLQYVVFKVQSFIAVALGLELGLVHSLHASVKLFKNPPPPPELNKVCSNVGLILELLTIAAR